MILLNIKTLLQLPKTGELENKGLQGKIEYFGTNEVRTAVKDNGDVYFCLKDIATVLGIQDTQTKNFNLDEKGVEKIPTPTKGGIQNITRLNRTS